MSIRDIPVREHMAGVSIANVNKCSVILEASEQALGTWPTTTPHIQTATSLGSLASYDIYR